MPTALGGGSSLRERSRLSHSTPTETDVSDAHQEVSRCLDA